MSTDIGKVVTIVCIAGLSVALLASVLYTYVSEDAEEGRRVPPPYYARPAPVPELVEDATKFVPALDVAEQPLAPAHEPERVEPTPVTIQLKEAETQPALEPSQTHDGPALAVGTDIASAAGQASGVDPYSGVEWASA